MTLRTVPAAVVLLGLAAGFTHAALTTEAPPAVECFEDGSCSNGYCDPLQLCNAEQYR